MVRALNGNVKPAPKLHSFNHFCQKCLLLINPWLKFLTTALEMTALTWRLTHLCCHLLPRQLPCHHPLLRSHPFIAPPVPIGHSSMDDTSMPSLDDLDSVPLPSFQVPDQPSENTIEDSLPVNGIQHETPAVQYTIVHGGSKFGNDMLTDSRGYSSSNRSNLLHFRTSLLQQQK